MFHDHALLVRFFLGFVFCVLEYCSVVQCSAMDRVVRGDHILVGGVLEWNLPLQFCVCSIRFEKTLYIHFVVHFLSLLCQCRLHMVPRSLIGILMHLLAAESHSTSELLYLARYLNQTILVTECSTMWDQWVLHAGSMLLSWPELLSPFFIFHYFLFLLLPSVIWLWGLGSSN